MPSSCLLCGCPEACRIGVNGKPRYYFPVGDYLCSICTRIVSTSTQNKIRAAYDKAVELELTKKIAFLEQQLEDIDDGERSVKGIGKVSRQRVVRSRVVRQAQSSRNKVRSKHST